MPCRVRKYAVPCKEICRAVLVHDIANNRRQFICETFSSQIAAPSLLLNSLTCPQLNKKSRRFAFSLFSLEMPCKAQLGYTYMLKESLLLPVMWKEKLGDPAKTGWFPCMTRLSVDLLRDMFIYSQCFTIQSSRHIFHFFA